MGTPYISTMVLSFCIGYAPDRHFCFGTRVFWCRNWLFYFLLQRPTETEVLDPENFSSNVTIVMGVSYLLKFDVIIVCNKLCILIPSVPKYFKNTKNILVVIHWPWLSMSVMENCSLLFSSCHQAASNFGKKSIFCLLFWKITSRFCLLFSKLSILDDQSLYYMLYTWHCIFATKICNFIRGCQFAFFDWLCHNCRLFTSFYNILYFLNFPI